jgi:hypothetical protein
MGSGSFVGLLGTCIGKGRLVGLFGIAFGTGLIGNGLNGNGLNGNGLNGNGLTIGFAILIGAGTASMASSLLVLNGRPDSCFTAVYFVSFGYSQGKNLVMQIFAFLTFCATKINLRK